MRAPATASARFAVLAVTVAIDYREKAPLAERNSPNGCFSFSMGHATSSFAIATLVRSM